MKHADSQAWLSSLTQQKLYYRDRVSNSSTVGFPEVPVRCCRTWPG